MYLQFKFYWILQVVQVYYSKIKKSTYYDTVRFFDKNYISVKQPNGASRKSRSPRVYKKQLNDGLTVHNDMTRVTGHRMTDLHISGEHIVPFDLPRRHITNDSLM